MSQLLRGNVYLDTVKNADALATNAEGKIVKKVGLLDETAHDQLDHTGLTGVPSITGLLDETAHDQLDHTGLTGILDETAHDQLDHTGLTGIPDITGLLDETAHDVLDHTGLTGVPATASDVGAVPIEVVEDAHTPSGFLNHGTSTLALAENYGAVNDTFRVTITGTDFPVYIDGVKYLKNTEYVEQVGATSKRYFIYYDATSSDKGLTISGTAWDLESGSYDGSAPVCTVLWDAVNHQGILEEERHHSWRDIHWHHWAHHSVGTRYSQGHTPNGLNITYGGASPNLTFSISGGEIYDEDISIVIGTHTVCNLFYHHDANTMKWVADSTAPYLLSGGVPQYDTGSGIAGKTANNSTGHFVSWIYATNSYVAGPDANIAIIIGQDTNGTMTLAEARAVGAPTLPADFILEWKLLFKSIFLYNGATNISHVESTDYRTSSSLPSGLVPTSTIGAASVVFSPTGDVASTNVQAAIEELDTEKAPLASPAFTGSPTVAVSLLPDTNDGATLGAATTGEWSDLFLAEGAVINWDNGDATLTQTGNVLKLAGAALETDGNIELGHASDTTIARSGAGTVTIEGNQILTVAGGTLTGSITFGENTALVQDPALSADGKYCGITRAGTCGYATSAFGDLIYLNDADSRWELADANLSDGYDAILGVCLTASAGDGDAITVLLHGLVRADAKFPTLTIGKPAYMSETAGSIVTAAPTTADSATRVVGYGITADELYFNPSCNYYTHT